MQYRVVNVFIFCVFFFFFASHWADFFMNKEELQLDQGGATAAEHSSAAVGEQCADSSAVLPAATVTEEPARAGGRFRVPGGVLGVE